MYTDGKRLELVDTVNKPDKTFKCLVKEGNLGKDGGENFDMRGRYNGGRLYRVSVKKGLIYTTGIELW